MIDPETEELLRKQMAADKAAETLFWSTRGRAIQSYASLEQALFRLFCGLTRMDMMTAGTMFFRINNTVARNAIIEELFKKHFKDEYNTFRNSLIKQLRPIDLDRNQLVHWHSIKELKFEKDVGYIATNFVLERPQYWDIKENAGGWDVKRMEEFSTKCWFYHNVIIMFSTLKITSPTTAHNVPASLDAAWSDIFRQPIVYPPPADHLSRLMLQTVDSPLRSFPG